MFELMLMCTLCISSSLNYNSLSLKVYIYMSFIIFVLFSALTRKVGALQKCPLLLLLYDKGRKGGGEGDV